MDGAVELAKQVLSQLSYTPTKNCMHSKTLPDALHTDPSETSEKSFSTSSVRIMHRSGGLDARVHSARKLGMRLPNAFVQLDEFHDVSRRRVL